MIKKLQLRFVLLSMACFALVLVVLVGAINVVNYSRVVSEADEVLALLQEGKNEFLQIPGVRPNHMPPGMSPEIPYESRYFTVQIDAQSNTVLRVDTSRVVSVDKTKAAEYAIRVHEKGSTEGFVDQFRYRRHAADGRIEIIFLDCGRKLDAFRSFLLISIGISLLGYGVVFVLIAVSSRRVVRPIAESYEKQKQFITDAGHELKTPLTVIRADVEVLESELGDNEWLSDIQKQTKRLSELTNDLVLLSRMEESGSKLTMIDFSVSDAVEETAASFQTAAAVQGKCLHWEIAPLLTLCGDEKAVRQLVGILLDNALKHSASESQVLLTLKKQGKGIQLTVQNAVDVPIPEAALGKLFERFYRLDPSRNSQTGGYGIGLSVAKAIVAAHGGRIAAAMEADRILKITATFSA